MHESAIQIGDGQKFFAFDGVDGAGVQAIAPIGRGGGFFVHREAFGEPAGDAVVGHLERVHVAEFVPHGAGPMPLAGRTRAGGIHGDYVAEGDA